MTIPTDLLVWADENGTYYGRGHMDPATFKAAAHADDIAALGADHDCTTGECSAGMKLEDVEHEYWYPLDPADDETAYRKCGPDHPGAEPWTVWRAWWAWQ